MDTQFGRYYADTYRRDLNSSFPDFPPLCILVAPLPPQNTRIRWSDKRNTPSVINVGD